MTLDDGRASQRFEQIEKRLSDVEVGFVASVDKNFDSDAYRKALEFTTKEHVYSRIRNLIAGVMLLGAGIFWVLVGGIVDRAVAAKEQQLQTLATSVRRERLLDLLQTFQENIRSEEDFQPLLEDIHALPNFRELLDFVVSEPRSDRELQLALTYVVRQKDQRAAELAVTHMLKSGRATAARALADSLSEFEFSETFLARIKPELDAVPRGSRARSAVMRLFSTSRLTPEWLTALMASSIRSGVIEEAEAAMTYFVVNPSEWENEYWPGNKQARGNLQDFHKLIQIQLSDAGEEEERQAMAILDKLEEKELAAPAEDDRPSAQGASSHSASSLFKAIKARVSLYFLERGRLELFDQVMYDGYYTDNDWQTRVRPLFAEFRPSVSYGPQTAHEIQDELWKSTDDFEWVDGRYARRHTEPSALPPSSDSAQTMSLEQLGRGELGGFIEFMRTHYYAESVWQREVWPLFAGVSKRELPFINDPVGTDEEQDQLWHWAEERRRDLRWTGSAWSLRTDTQAQ